ncbi:MAG TPA: asparagine synthase (glutamine-hydrolyzing) [Pyrinomonadaceae bacterium]|jgi:asparagine synthase (glutamine-hydrolysing)|nr:asparagine synthase (glutamine-hydrolyzing) [Pyrinomonadaceae bacterium]
MCGINGIAFSSKSGRLVSQSVLEAMRDVITHRGPDEEGLFIDRNVGLGHRRLSIVDVASGHQPMTNAEDGTLHITYNGEIYNHADYRESLEAKGHVYATHCDTETILHLYEEHGSACVDYLRGMFAFAIWDQRKRELFIARDRLGVKPLYYVYTDDGSLYFGSEIKTLLEAGAIKPELNYAGFSDYLANHATSGEETLFRGVKRLLPGHVMTWRDGELTIRRYWDVDFSKDDAAPRDDKTYVKQWSELFRESVRLRLMADVPLGMFLSGGIDSSAIAAVMSGMVSEPIKTFSVAFAEREANELEYARLIADAYKTNHHEIVVSPEQFFAALPRLVWHEDEPLAHPSSVALYFVSHLAAQHVKVVLTGEGSDELLAGYGRYRRTIWNLALGHQYKKFTPAVARDTIRKQIERMLPGGRMRQKLMRTFLVLSPALESIYFDNFAVFPAPMQQHMFTRETHERIGNIDPYVELRRLLERTKDLSLLDSLLYADIKTYLHELLMKQDQMSMATSIESRVPFLDHKLVEFTARMPDTMKLRGGTTKYVLRESMKGVLPEKILSRRKMGFPVPIGSWFRGAFRSIIDEYVLSERALSRDIFAPEFVRRLVSQHQAGEDHSERLWALVNFEMWQRRFFDSEAPPAAEPMIEKSLVGV